MAKAQFVVLLGPDKQFKAYRSQLFDIFDDFDDLAVLTTPLDA